MPIRPRNTPLWSMLIAAPLVTAGVMEAESGDTLDNLLAIQGDPSAEQQYEMSGLHLAQLYYQELDRSYLINLETGYICDVYRGKEKRACSANGASPDPVEGGEE